jgi:type IV pilus assembly protein PilB
LGELLVNAGLLTESQVTQVLSQQLSMPWVALQHIDFSRQLLNLVPAEVAEKYGIVPIYVRRARNRKQTLYVAMQDPLDLSPLEEIEQHSGLPVRPMIAPPSDIRGAVRAYYLGLPPEEELDEEVAHISGHPPGVSILPPPPQVKAGPPPAPSRAMVAPAPPPISGVPPTGAERSAADEDDEAPASQPLPPRGSIMPTPKAKAPRMVTMTMLDGTEIALPAARGRKRASDGSGGDGDGAEGLTARDLVDALRAQGDGVDVSEVLGEDVNWQQLFAALLSLLLKKHLVTDWEFVRELKRKAKSPES